MKLSKEDWLKHGMKVLAEDGFGALKADLMAKSLGVSRGSFYWHFKDLQTFHAELLEDWHTRATQQVIDWLEQTAEGSQRLNLLVQKAWTVSNRLERGMRAWATHSPDIAARLEAIDARRIDYIASSLESAGLAPDQARARAFFIASAYLGRIILGDGAFGNVPEKELSAIVKLLQSRGQ